MSEIETREGVDLDALEALLAKATVPVDEWRTCPTERLGVTGISGLLTTTPKGFTGAPYIADVFGGENAALIVAAVNALPALIGERAAVVSWLRHSDVCMHCGTLAIAADEIERGEHRLSGTLPARTPAQTQTYSDGFAAGLEAAAKVAEERRKIFVVGPDVRTTVFFTPTEVAEAIRALKEPS